MNILNIEIKARCSNPKIIEKILLKNNAKYIKLLKVNTSELIDKSYSDLLSSYKQTI